MSSTPGPQPLVRDQCILSTVDTRGIFQHPHIMGCLFKQASMMSLPLIHKLSSHLWLRLQERKNPKWNTSSNMIIRFIKSPSVTADLAVSESLEELTCLAPIPAPSESESLGVGPECCMFKKAPRLTLTCGPCQNNCARLTLTLGRGSLRLREGRYLDQSCFQVVTGKGPRFPDSPPSALREGTAPSRAPRHMYKTARVTVSDI